MKKKLHLVFILMISVMTLALAQVSEEEKAMSMGVNNAIMVEIPQTTTKIAEKVWKNYIKEFKGKTKKNRKTEEWKTTNAKISAFGEAESVVLYAQIQSNNEDVELTMWVPLSEGFLSSETHPDAYKEADRMLNAYALEVRIETVKIELKKEEKTLSGQEKNLKKLKKDNENYHKDIKNAEKKIEESEKGLIKNAENQKNAVQNVRLAEDIFSVQKGSLEVLLSGATDKKEKKSIKKEIRGEEKKVKDAKGVQKKAEREEKKLHKTIKNSKNTITDSKEKIVTNLQDQETKNQEIGTQKGVVAGVNERLKKLEDYK